MTLKGIDISNWQAGFDVKNAPCDFVIVKATEGLNFVDKYCDGFVQQAKESSKLWGFYHFARNNDPVAEADFFYNNCKNYFKHGIPVIDIEDAAIRDWGLYANTFAIRIHDLTGVWPMVYCSASQLYRFSGFPTVYNNCGLWVAGYPKNYTSWPDDNVPYDIAPWKIVAIWQFTSSLAMGGMSIDGDYAYMDSRAWKLYAGENAEVKPAPTPKPSNDSFKKININDAISRIAMECINGTYGNGDARKNNLYNTIQNRINEMINGG